MDNWQKQLKPVEVSTSAAYTGYVPYSDLHTYSVFFRGQELGIKGPHGMKYANSRTGTVILNNGRILRGDVKIKSVPPF